jgi:predicted phosphatase
LLSLASYNHAPPVFAALQALDLFEFFEHPVVEWSGQKDQMLLQVLHAFARDGYVVSPESTLFVDDDQPGRYRQQMAEIGVNFLQRGVDLHSLDELLDHPDYTFVPGQKRA